MSRGIGPNSHTDVKGGIGIHLHSALILGASSCNGFSVYFAF